MTASRRTIASAFLVVSATLRLGVPAAAAQSLRPTLTPQHSGTQSLLQAVSPVSEQVVWVSGHRGTYVRTTDGGATWTPGVVPGADSLQFRDVHGVSADIAYMLAAGPGDRSRIYKTLDGGRSWRLQFRNTDSLAFYDCFDFWDAEHGLAFSDAVRGSLVVIETMDGETWTPLPAERLPPSAGSEGGFAASGTCVRTLEDSLAWIGTGAGDEARVLRTADRGLTWSVATTPIVHGNSSGGIASLAFRDRLHGLALGGDIGKPDSFTTNVARTEDGGRTWRAVTRPPFSGAVYGSAYAPGKAGTLVAAGPKGLALTTDDGKSWTLLSGESHWAVGFAAGGVGWAVGPGGRITRIDLAR